MEENDEETNGATKDNDGDEGEEKSPELNIQPGETIQGSETSYRVIRRIGEGRCSIVYSGETINSAEPVALKFFRTGSTFKSAAEAEAKVFSLLAGSVKTAVSLYSTTIYKGLICFVLELLDLNIRQLIIKNIRSGLPVWTTLKFARDIFSFLKPLHQANYAHGDIKPGNIMWSGQDGCFKCFDFGLSYSLDSTVLHLTQSTGYRAPELTRTYKEAASHHSRTRDGYIYLSSQPRNNNYSVERISGAGTDIWALGCILMECVLGRKLFRAGDRLSSHLRVYDLVELRLEEVRSRFEEHQQSEIFQHLKDLILRCLKENPDMRITAEEALKHPALTSSIPLSRADTILLPSPVLSFSSVNHAHLRAVQDKLNHSQVLEQRIRGNQLFVQFKSIKESIRAKSVLSCEGVRNIDLFSTEDIIIYKHQTATSNYKTEFYPLELWYKMEEAE